MAHRREEPTVPADPWLARLIDAAVRVRRDAGPEPVHDLRVALARLEVWLAFGGGRALRRDLRWLRRRAGAVRDLDVGLSLRPPDAVAAACRRRHAAARGRLLGALRGPRAAALFEALARAPEPTLAAARRSVARMARRARRRGRRAARDPGDVPALHALRRAVRRLRFALEWTGRPARPLVALQGAIGRACDRSVALRHAASDGREVRAYRRRLERELRAETSRAGEAWARARPVLKRLAARRADCSLPAERSAP